MPSGHRCASQTSAHPAMLDAPGGLRYIPPRSMRVRGFGTSPYLMCSVNSASAVLRHGAVRADGASPYFLMRFVNLAAPCQLRCIPQNSMHFSKPGALLDHLSMKKWSRSAPSFPKCCDLSAVHRGSKDAASPPCHTAVSTAHKGPAMHRSVQGARKPRAAPRFPSAPRPRGAERRVFHEQTFPIANARHEGHPRRFGMPKTLR